MHPQINGHGRGGGRNQGEGKNFLTARQLAALKLT
jgi:hypothetical protein